MRKSWAEIDAERQALPRKLSRAEMCRRAGISESAVTKGLKHGRTPYKDVRERVELVLEAERHLAQAGLR